MKYLFTFATLMMAACLDSEKEDTPEEENENNESSSLQPQEGSWLVNINITEDSCGFFADQGGLDTGEQAGDEMTITNTGSNKFSVTMDGGTDEAGQELEDNVFSCSTSGQTFTCTPSTSEIELSETSVIEYTMSFRGSFSSPTELSGTTRLDADCVGADCGMLSDFGLALPCSASGSATGYFAGEEQVDTAE